MGKVKIIAVVLIIIVIFNFVIMLFGKIRPLVFWAIAALIALLAYKVIPHYSKK